MKANGQSPPKRRLRVLLGALSFGDGNTGVALSAELLARMLEPVCDVAVLTGSRGEGADSTASIQELRLLGQRAAIPMLLRLPMRLLGITRQVEHAVSEFRPDLIHLQDTDLADPVIPVARSHGIPVVVSVRDARFLSGLAHQGPHPRVHGPMPWTRTRSFLEIFSLHDLHTWPLPLLVPFLLAKPARIRNLLRQASLLLPTSQFLMQGLRQSLIRTPARVLPLVPVPDWAPAPPRTAGPLRFIAVGRLVRGKGFECLLESFARVLQSQPEAELVLVGDGPRRNRIERLAQRLGCASQIRFGGGVPYHRMRECYAESDIVVFPSLVPEGFGRVVVEAARVGRPVIASAVGGVPEFVEAGCGVLVPPGNVEALAQAMLDLARNPQLGSQMVARAQRKAAALAGRDLCAQVLTLYHAVTTGSLEAAAGPAPAEPIPALTLSD